MSSVSWFYIGVAAARLLLAIAYSAGARRDVCVLDLSNPIARCPSWLPYGYLRWLHRPVVYRVLYHTVPVTMALAAIWPESWPLRLLAAVHFAHAHLALTSLTHGHDEYLSLWVLIGLASPVAPEVLGPAVALAGALYLMIASGVGKLVVGGASDWVKPGTLAAVLRSTLHLPAPVGPALPKALVGKVLASPRLLTTMAIATLGLELLLPLGLLLPSGVPLLLICVAFHLGHASLMSTVIGLPFAINHLPVYGLGFLAAWPVFSLPWTVGVCLFVAVVIMLVTRRSRMLPESWPCTSYPLFAHSALQHEQLVEPICEGRRRLVVFSERCPNPPIGCVLEEPWWKTLGDSDGPEDVGGQAVGGSGARVYDAWHLCFGWTHSVEPTMFRQASGPADLAQLVQQWLQDPANDKLYERSSDVPLAGAALVELAANESRVERVASSPRVAS